MTATVLETYATPGTNQTASLNTTTSSSFWCKGLGQELTEGILAQRVEIAMVLALLVGVCQVCFFSPICLAFFVVIVIFRYCRAFPRYPPPHYRCFGG